MIKNIIFGLDNVLVSDDFFHNPVPKYEVLLRKELGIGSRQLINSYYKYHEQYSSGIINEDSFWKLVLSDSKARINVGFCKDFVRRTPFKKPGITPLLRSLKLGGYNIVVLSDDSRDMTVHKLEVSGLKGLVDSVLLVSELGASKTDEELYSLVADELNASILECLFVDHSIEHIVPAEFMGMRVAWFRNVHDLWDDLKNKGISV